MLKTEVRTEMRICDKNMALLWYIYEVNYQYLESVPELGVGDDVNGIVNLVLDEKLHNIRRARKDDHAEHDKLSSGAM